MPEHVIATLGDSLLSGVTHLHMPAGSGSSELQEAGLHERGGCARDWSEQHGTLDFNTLKELFFLFSFSFLSLFISYFAFKCLS